jgi:hypothetical protein
LRALDEVGEELLAERTVIQDALCRVSGRKTQQINKQTNNSSSNKSSSNSSRSNNNNNNNKRNKLHHPTTSPHHPITTSHHHVHTKDAGACDGLAEHALLHGLQPLPLLCVAREEFG